jgi:hypothetical protein
MSIQTMPDIPDSWGITMRRFATTTAPTPEAWMRIVEGPRVDPKPARGPSRRPLAAIAVAAAVLLLAGFLAVTRRDGHDPAKVKTVPAHPGHRRSAPPVYRTSATVVQQPGGKVEACLVTVEVTSPPQCGDTPLVGWVWGGLESQTAKGTRWGVYDLVGTYDGTSFTLTAPPVVHVDKGTSPQAPVVPSPCSAPGHAPASSSGKGPATLDAAKALVSKAEQLPGYAGYWKSGPPGAVPDSVEQTYNIAVSGASVPAVQSALSPLWPGPICVVDVARSYKELQALELQARTALEDRGIRWLDSGFDPIHNRIEITIALATPALQDAFDRRFGAGAIFLSSILKQEK